LHENTTFFTQLYPRLLRHTHAHTPQQKPTP
jgi:hypothetical protein